MPGLFSGGNEQLKLLVSGHPRDGGYPRVAKKVFVTGAGLLRKCQNIEFVRKFRKNEAFVSPGLSRAALFRRECPFARRASALAYKPINVLISGGDFSQHFTLTQVLVKQAAEESASRISSLSRVGQHQITRR